MRESLSIIIPVFNEESLIQKSIRIINAEVLKLNIPYEIIVIDDGSKDKTWNKLLLLSEEIPQISAYRFSRNFGKESALSAGLTKANGDAVILMDCDLQHPPSYIEKMVSIWLNNDVDIVECVKESRGKESLLYKASASLFYATLNKMTGYKMDGASDFKLLDRKVVDAWSEMEERNVFFRGMSAWLGFKKEFIYFQVENRLDGESKWSILGLCKLALNAIVSFSALPLRLISIFGLIFLCISLVLGVQTLYEKFLGEAVTGFTTVILLLLFIGSVLMISLGIIGEYIAAIYNEVKRRPRYIISEQQQTKLVSKREVEKYYVEV